MDVEKADEVSMNAPNTRRDQIAEAGIRVIANRGVRALTHRAVDGEAGLPPGSTSYYAPTRRALIDQIVRVLAEHSIADVENAVHSLPVRGGAPTPAAREHLVDALVDAVSALARRPAELKVRCALLLELDRDEPARTTLVEHSPVQHQMAHQLNEALNAAGVAATVDHARDVMSFCDALLMRSVITGAPAQIKPALSTYIRGLVDSEPTP